MAVPLNPKNLKAMTEFTRGYGVCSASSRPLRSMPGPESGTQSDPGPRNSLGRAGVCIPWDEKLIELPPISGDPDVARRIRESIDGLGNMYIWQCLLSF